MKLTNIRDEKGKKLPIKTLEMIGEALVSKLGVVGFITDNYIINSSRIDLKLSGKFFKIDVNKLGYNAQLNPHCTSEKGYRRTSTPTWEQRVQCNNIINKILDHYGVSATIKSGAYTIRSGFKVYSEIDWRNQRPEWEYHNESLGYKVVSLNDEPNKTVLTIVA